MADIVLKNIDGEPETYTDVDQIVLQSVDGEDVIYTEGTGGTGSIVQADYSQNDETQTDFIKNRPFYDNTTLVKESINSNFLQVTNQTAIASFEFEQDFFPTEGIEYTVEVDGEKYSSVCSILQVKENEESYCLGNVYRYVSLSEDTIEEADNFTDTGEPFIIICSAAETGYDLVCCIFDIAEPSQHTIRIYKGKVHQIDPKYIPDSINISVDYEENDSANPGFIKNRPFYDNSKTLLEWDGNTEGLEYIEIQDTENSDPEICYYKISDTPFAVEELYNNAYIFTSTEERCEITEDNIITKEDSETLGDAFALQEFLLVTPDDLTMSMGSTPVTFTKGIWHVNPLIIGNVFLKTIVNGEIKKLDAKFLPDSVQADWDENDTENRSYIKNRPFYKSGTSEEVVLQNQSLTFEYDDQWLLEQAIPEALAKKWLSDDYESVKVICDGVEYICTPFYIQGTKCIGDLNGSLYPFLFGVVIGEGGYTLMGYSYDEAPSDTTITNTIAHTFSFSLLTDVIEYLPEKYINRLSWEKISNTPLGTYPSGYVIYEDTITIESDITVGQELSIKYFDPSYYDGVNKQFGVSITDEDDSIYNYDLKYSDGFYGFVSNDEYLGAIIAFEYSIMAIESSSTIVLKNAGTYKIQVSLQQDFVKQLDEKYIPDSIKNNSSSSGDSSTSLPSISTENEGSFLRVINGVATWQQLTDVSEVGA